MGTWPRSVHLVLLSVAGWRRRKTQGITQPRKLRERDLRNHIHKLWNAFLCRWAKELEGAKAPGQSSLHLVNKVFGEA